MKAIERLSGVAGKAGALCAVYLAGHLALMGFTYIAYPQTPYLDALGNAKSVYVSAPKYLLLNLDAARSDRRRILIFGASSAAVAFRPELIQPHLPDYSIHNAAVGNSSITTIKQTLDLIQQASPAENDVVVIATWPGLFAQEGYRLPGARTELENEMLRFNFAFEDSEGRLVRTVPTWLYPLLGDIYRPYLIAGREASCPLCAFRRIEEGERINPQSEWDQERQDWRMFFGFETAEWPTYEFEVLTRMVREQSKAGNQVLIVQLPVAAWLSEDNPDFQAYERAAAIHLTPLADLPGVHVTAMEGLSDPAGFRDGTHPRISFRPVWSKALADIVRREIEGGAGGDMVGGEGFEPPTPSV